MRSVRRRTMLAGAASFGLVRPGRAAASRAEFTHLAGIAVDDLLRHFWDGPAEGGHIRPTWGGYAAEHGALPDPRGALWERAMLINALFEFHALTGAPEIAARLRADWRFVSGAFSAADLTECGRHAHANWQSDDTGWDSLLFLQMHAITGDPVALDYAARAVGNAYARWQDAQLGGGLWYSDDRTRKSLYETALALAALRLHALTHETRFKDDAVASETWMRHRLRRADALYWCEVTQAGPVGGGRPNDIHAGGSVTYLGGEMAISVLQTRLAATLHKPELRVAAAETAKAVARILVDPNGVLLDDRDAWNDGYFAALWAREVIAPNGPEADALRATARAVAAKDRSADGFYGADWDGPSAESRWARGRARPEQIMTSASAATLIIAAAFLP